MTTPHRATPKQWEVIGICKEEGKIPWPTATCLLELRARIEALEAAQREAPMTELRAASAEARPAAREIFPVEYADSNGEGIRIIMEPAEETGQVCWVVRNSRRVSPIHEFPTPEAAYAAHQARAEARPAVLVEQVSKRIEYGIDANQDPDGTARAAIRDVASWLEMEGYFAASRAITLELDPT
jgi:hypothetical protein